MNAIQKIWCFIYPRTHIVQAFCELYEASITIARYCCASVFMILSFHQYDVLHIKRGRSAAASVNTGIYKMYIFISKTCAKLFLDLMFIFRTPSRYRIENFRF